MAFYREHRKLSYLSIKPICRKKRMDDREDNIFPPPASSPDGDERSALSSAQAHGSEREIMLAVCGTCGSARVKIVDASAFWNIRKQKWCTDSDDSVGGCRDCGAGGDDYEPCDIMYVPAHDKVL